MIRMLQFLTPWAVFAIAGGLLVAHPAQAESRPNVVWICLDAARAENFSCYGYPRATSPNLERLGERGAVMEQCFAQVNYTLFSVPSYMTGRFFPVPVLYNSGWRRLWKTPPEGERLFPDILRQAGYTNALISAHARFAPEGRLWPLFDHAQYIPPEISRKDPFKARTPMERLVEAADAWLEKAPEKPFFMYLHAMDTHFPHSPLPPHDRWLPKIAKGEEALKQGQKVNKPYFTDEERAYLYGLYDGAIHYTDEQIGRLLGKLGDHGLLDNTLIVVSSDHGDVLGENGKALGHPPGLSTDEVLRVPLVMAGPGIPEGRRLEHLSMNVDIVPTLLDLLDIEVDVLTEGRSLVQALRDEDAPAPHEYVFSNIGYGADHSYVLRTTEFKFEHYTHTGDSRLWRLPDQLGRRVDCAMDYPEVADTLRAAMESEIAPLRAAFDELPLSSPRPFFISIGYDDLTADSKAAVTREPANDDNLWSLSGKLLQACTGEEECPPVTLRMQTPEARLRVLASLVVPPDAKRTSVRYKTPGDNAFKSVAAEFENKRNKLVELGVYDLTDGEFEITLATDPSVRWASIESFFFIPVETEAADLEGIEQREEQLRALGYLE